jgi:hypothetical protein
MNLEMDLYNPCWGPKNTGFPRKNKGVRSEWRVGTYFPFCKRLSDRHDSRCNAFQKKVLPR